MRITIRRAAIDAFKAQWPCHGFPASLDRIELAFEQGDLVDIDCFTRNGRMLDRHAFDGEALNALTSDHNPEVVERARLNAVAMRREK
jgi:phosphoribosyl-dephospho-CoA transferase